MPGAVASAALLVGGSLIVGQAVLALCGRREWTPLAGPLGLAVALVVCGAIGGWGGRGTAIAIALLVLVLAAVAVLAATMPRPPLDPLAALAAALAALAASIPFIAAGHVGILGVGLVNDDMASHLLLADWIAERFRPEPVLIDQGYPLGPHALVAGLASGIGSTSIHVFAGLTLAIPSLAALVAWSALDGLRRWRRTLAAVLVALPYLAAAYLAQEAFKEPIMALFVLTFTLLLAKAEDWRDAIPLGVLAAGVTYVYSFPGLAWLGGVLCLWIILSLITRSRRVGNEGEGPEERRRSGDGPRDIRSMDARTVRSRDAKPSRGAVTRTAALTAAAVGIVVVLVLLIPELGRLNDFVDFRALHPDHANEGGLGNLSGQLSPLEALGIWPTSDFRLSAVTADPPALIFFAAGAFALVALVLALPRWIRRHGAAIPAALAAAAVLYLLALGLGTVYTSAKALAIAAPLVMLITLGGLLDSNRRWLVALGAVFALAAAATSFLILRQAPVAPTAHAEELRQIRSVVEGEKLLFLGRDNFVLYELRGSKPYTHVRNFYDPYFVEPNFDLANVGSKFDFDSVTATTLAEFPYVLTTKAEYASGPPPGYRVAASTDSYELWEKNGTPLGREPGESDQAPGRHGRLPAAATGARLELRRGARRRRRLVVGYGRERRLGDDRARPSPGRLGPLASVRRHPPGDADRAVGSTPPCPATSTTGARRRTGPPRGRVGWRRRGDHRDGRGPAARRASARCPFGRSSRGNRGDQHRAPPRRVRRLRRLVRALMDLSFGEALLIFGSLLAVVAALSGLMRGTVLSASVLSIALGIVLAELDLVSVDVGDEGIVELIELALILTLVSDGLLGRSRAARPPLGTPRAGAGRGDADHLAPLGARREAAVRRAQLGGVVPARRGALRD